MPTHFTAQQIRDILKVKSHCLRASFPPDDPLILTLDEIILARIQKVGKPAHVSEQLGPLWKVPAGNCRFFFASGLEAVPPAEWEGRGAGQYVVARFIWNGLPFRVEGGGVVRYL